MAIASHSSHQRSLGGGGGAASSVGVAGVPSSSSSASAFPLEALQHSGGHTRFAAEREGRGSAAGGGMGLSHHLSLINSFQPMQEDRGEPKKRRVAL